MGDWEVSWRLAEGEAYPCLLSMFCRTPSDKHRHRSLDLPAVRHLDIVHPMFDQQAIERTKSVLPAEGRVEQVRAQVHTDHPAQPITTTTPSPAGGGGGGAGAMGRGGGGGGGGR